MSLKITPPQQIYYDKDGTPLDAGFIYIGQVSQNPETNQVAVYWDSALTLPAPQPIRTLNGYPSRQGVIANIYTASSFSITVKSKRKELVFTSSFGNSSGSNYALLVFPDYAAASAAAATLPDGQYISVSENLKTYTVGSGALTDERPTYPAGVGTADRSQQNRNAETISVADYAGDSHDAIFAAAAADANGRTVEVPAGTWNITAPVPTAARWHLRSGAVIAGLPESLTVMDTSRLTGSVFTEKCGSGIGGLKIGNPGAWLGNYRTVGENGQELSAIATQGRGGLMGGSRTSDNPNPSGSTSMGVFGWVINDNTSGAHTGWASYLEAMAYPGCGNTIGQEIDFRNYGPTADIQPYGGFTGGKLTTNQWLSAGGGTSSPTPGNDVSVALGILPNGAKFKRGIVFRDGALDSSLNQAVVLPAAYRFAWYSAVNELVAYTDARQQYRRADSTVASEGTLDTHRRTRNNAVTEGGDIIHRSEFSARSQDGYLEAASVQLQQRTAMTASQAAFSYTVRVANADGSTTPMVISSYLGTPSFYCDTDNFADLGGSTRRFKQLWAMQNTINTCDGREKSEPLAIDDLVLDAWGDVNFFCYQWLDAIERKGEDIARWHFGVIAQRVRDAFAARGLDGTRYGLLCYDEWGDEYKTIDAVIVRHPAKYSSLQDVDGNPIELSPAWEEEIEPARQELVMPAGNRWGIRADQCHFLEAAYQRRRADRIEARLTAIEAKLQTLS